jgi:PAS domain S-box-containing protein
MAEGTKKNGDSVPLNLYTFVVKEDAGATIIVEERAKSFSASDSGLMQLVRSLMDNIPDSIYFKDEENRLLMVNNSLARGLGLTVEQVIGKTDFDLFPAKDAEKYFADDSHVLKTGKSIINKIEKSYGPDGKVQYVSTTKIPRIDASGRIVGTIGITRNVTERLLAEEELRALKDGLEEKVKERTRELEESQEKLVRMYNIKSEFINTVSHELRTPLTVMKEGISLVSDGTAGELNDNQKKFLGIAMDNIDRLARLIDDVLDLSKLESGRMQFSVARGNLNELLDNVIKSYEPLIAKKGLKLRKDLSPSLPLIKFDKDRIAQVLYNLITNAIKFTDKGSISIRSRKRGDRVEVSVEDTGRGIRTKDMPRLFQKFEQINPEDGPRNKGTGLGLVIIKQIIEQLGGEIRVESQYGKSSRFTFTLPI